MPTHLSWTWAIERPATMGMQVFHSIKLTMQFLLQFALHIFLVIFLFDIIFALVLICCLICSESWLCISVDMVDVQCGPVKATQVLRACVLWGLLA